MKYVIIIILWLCFRLAFAGGPWLQSHKKGYVQTQLTLPGGYYNRLFLENGQDAVLPYRVLDTHWQNYMEYGWLKHTNILLDVPVKYVAVNNQFVNHGIMGFSNIKLGIKQQIFNKKWLSSVTIWWQMNTVRQALAYSLSTGYNDNFISANVAVGRGWSKWYFYTEMQLNRAFIRYSDSWNVVMELGKKIQNKHWLAVTVSSLQSLKNRVNSNHSLELSGLYPNNQEYLAYGMKFIYSLKHDKQGITLATYGALSGNYVAHLFTLNAGYYWKF